MSKKTPQEIEDFEGKKHQVVAKRLKYNEGYEKDLGEYKGSKTRLVKALKKGAIEHKYSIAKPYDIDEIESVIKGEAALYEEAIKVVQPIDSKGDGYICLKIKKDEPKELIHYAIDCYLKGEGKINRERPKENLKALEVWKERLLRKSFKIISEELNITEANAKKRFYKAYELIFNEKYDPSKYKKPEVKKEYLKRECNTCEERATCQEPCPDIIGLVNQDYISSDHAINYDLEKIDIDEVQKGNKRIKPQLSPDDQLD